jgi:hypothetical protein
VVGFCEYGKRSRDFGKNEWLLRLIEYVTIKIVRKVGYMVSFSG